LIGPGRGSSRIGNFVVGTDGAGARNLIVPTGGLRSPRTRESAEESTDDSGCTRSRDNLFMDGPAIFSFAITAVPHALAILLEKSRLTPGEIDWYVFHQANKYMLMQLAKRCRIPNPKMVFEMEDIGNTVSATIPISIQRRVEDGGIRGGQRLALVGFGVGYSWAACDVVWG
jgi:3-oxoacyl-[acyl-carrier-protein] synthase-3